MPNFKYKGRDKNGQIVEGYIEASSQSNVAVKLASVDVIPVTIMPMANVITVEELTAKYLGFGRPKVGDLIIFAQQMYTLTKAGVPIIRALRVVAGTTKHSSFRAAITEVVISLESGFSLSSALEKHPNCFSRLIVAMIEVGENTGQLDVAFLQIRHYLESELETERRIKTALRYPSMVIAAIVIAIGIINLLVIPAFRNFFTAFGATLPLPTRFLIACSDIFINYGWIIAIFATIGVTGFIMYLQLPQGKWWWSYFKIKIPFVGSIVERAIFARFCRAFSMTVTTNVPLLQAFKVVANVVDNDYLEKKLLKMRSHIENGETLYSAASKSTLFSPLVLQMLAVGEETGQIDNILLDVAQFYEKDVDYDLKRLGDAIEPILIIIIALMVLTLALGVFLPMWDISTVALRKMEGL